MNHGFSHFPPSWIVVPALVILILCASEMVAPVFSYGLALLVLGGNGVGGVLAQGQGLWSTWAHGSLAVSAPYSPSKDLSITAVSSAAQVSGSTASASGTATTTSTAVATTYTNPILNQVGADP